MQTINHVMSFICRAYKRKGVSKETMEYIERSIPLLMLPDAIRMYGPRQQFHFTEHPITKRIHSVKFLGSPDNLKNIKNSFEANLWPDIPNAVIDEQTHIEEFERLNPKWNNSMYETHLRQDSVWDDFVRDVVDCSKRFDGEYLYKKSGRIVDGNTLRNDLAIVDKFLFLEWKKRIEDLIDEELDAKWFEKHIHQILLENYDEELAENTWKYVNLPDETEKIDLPDFTTKEEVFVKMNEMEKSSTLYNRNSLKPKILYQLKLILELLPKEEFDAIPQRVIDYIEDFYEYDENFKVDPNVPLDEQNIDEATFKFLEQIINESEKNLLDLETGNDESDDKLLQAKKLINEYRMLIEKKEVEIENLREQNETLMFSISRIPKLIRKIFIKENIKLLK